MRIVIDLHDPRCDRTLSLAETLAKLPGDHRIIIALPAVPLQRSLTLRQRFARYLPAEDIRVWHASGPEPVTDLVQAAFFAGLGPDMVITARRDLFPDLQAMDPGTIPEGALPDNILAAITAGVAARTGHDPIQTVSDRAAVKPTLAVVSPLPPERTGIAGYTADLLPALARYYDMDVIVSQAEISDPWTLEHCGIRTPDWFLKNGHRYDRILYHMGNSAFHHHMPKLMHKHPGVVCLHDFFLGHFARYTESRDPKSHHWAGQLYAGHGYLPVKDRFHDPDPDRVTVTKPCSFAVFRSALGIVVHSRYTRDLARNWYPAYPARHLAVIPLLRAPACAEHPPAPVPGTPAAGTGFVVCSFGMLGPFKQNHLLLSAWLNSGLADDPNCHLVFVGENEPGSYGRELVHTIGASRAKARIHITGWVTDQDFFAWLNTADAAVQLRTHSRGETSAAVLDCMNHGLPVIANAHAANAELPADAVWLLDDRFAEPDLVQALETLYQKPDLREKLGKTGRTCISRHHSPEACSRQYAQAIEGFYHMQRLHQYFLVPRLAALDCLPRNPDHLVGLSRDIAANQPAPVPEKRLFIDVSATWRNDLKAGIDRVSRSLVLALIQHPPKGFRAEPVYLDEKNRAWQYRYARAYTLGLLTCPDTWISDDPVEMQAGDRLFCPDLTGGILLAAQKAGLLEQIRNL
ncbi:MAG TPA: glycosyltransferase family 4 protein, partial [Desulfotignum sp.]|nr:glycosyltransferase family 4 protein [Desulfotignum sp.]